MASKSRPFTMVYLSPDMYKWLIAVMLLASSLRLFFLDSHIAALYGDEISIGYNAYSILKTGKDEFGKFLPLQFESWGDQKNPVYIYAVSLAEIIFGLSATAVRLPSALSGIAAVLLTFLLTRQITSLVDPSIQNQKKYEKIALLSAALLAISPWHILISRGGYEANMALTLGLLGAYLFLRWLQSNAFRNLIFSNISFTLAMYTYYTTKLFIPLFILLLWSFGYFFLNKKTALYLKKLLIYFAVFVLFCMPVIYLALFSNGQARFARINIFSNPDVSQRVISMRSQSLLPPSITPLLINKPYIWFRDFLEYFTDNFSASFWYVSGDSSLRYSIGNHGMFYLFEAPFFLLGLLTLFQKNKKLFLFLFLWMTLAVLPTALVGKAYGLRSLALLPVPLIFTSFGIFYLLHLAKAYAPPKIIQLTAASLIIIAFLSLSNWLIRYLYIYPSYGYYWYDGMQFDAVTYPMLQSKNYKNIILTRYYGKTEMYYAFYTQLDPAEYQKCSRTKVLVAGAQMVQCGQYYFGDINTKNKSFEDLNLPPETLVIGSPQADFGNETILAKDDKRILFKVIK